MSIILLHPWTRRGTINDLNSPSRYVDSIPRISVTMASLEAQEGISTSVHEIQGKQQRLTEVSLLGDTHSLDVEEMGALPCVQRVVRISREYRAVVRHSDGLGSI